ncbi:hypothetical protein GXW71_18700 [Roseomonas hellenica]|uniref:Uncharacterized protein n=1 Tax=Plastoroseomonas hellenica TaxID=2687306 RepID=A0ABS5F1G5_9PROT|nr:hypothetical protein [Plastoroseomonas hellenica]MBR0666397.1 hypothetical protein [Plastoroseomonas hellenica]
MAERLNELPVRRAPSSDPLSAMPRRHASGTGQGNPVARGTLLPMEDAMTPAERALLLLVAEHMAALLDAEAASLDAASMQAEQIRALIAKVLSEPKTSDA